MSHGANTPPPSPGGPIPAPPLGAIVRVVAVVVGVALSLYLIYLLRQPIGWLVLAGFVALATAGPTRALERRMRRGLAVTLVYLGVILAPFLILAVLVPPIVDQGTRLASDAPRYAADAQRIVAENETLRRLDRRYAVGQRLQAAASRLPSRLGEAAGTLVNLGAGIVSSVFTVVTILILAIFMVTGAPRWKSALASYQPPGREEALNRLFDRVGEAVGGYVRGALLQALIAGALSWLVLLLLGVPYALPLALVVGLLDLVPLVGATLGAVVVGIVTLFVDFPTATIVWVIWSIVLPASRERRDPTADHVEGRIRRPVRGAGVGALRQRAVRGHRSPALDPRGRHRPGGRSRVPHLPEQRPRRGDLHRPRAGRAVTRRSPAGGRVGLSKPWASIP